MPPPGPRSAPPDPPVTRPPAGPAEARADVEAIQRRHAAFVEIVRELADAGDVDRILSFIGRRVCELLEADSAVIALIEGDEIVLRGGYGLVEGVARRRPIARSRVGRVVRECRPFVSADMAADPHWKDSTLVTELGYRATLDVPILLRGEVIGVLGVVQRRPRTFADEDVRLVVALAEHAALALDRRNLLQALESRLRETETLLAVSRTAGSTLDPVEVARRTVREIVRALGADLGGMWRRRPGTDQYEPVAGYRLPAPVRPAFTGGRLTFRFSHPAPVYQPDSRDDPRFNRPPFSLIAHRAVLVAPVVLKGEITGVVTVAWTRPAPPLPPDAIRLAEGITAQAGIALENARLLEAERQLQRRQDSLLALSRELRTEVKLDTLLLRIAEEARRLAGSDASVLLLAEDDHLVIRASTGAGQELAIGRRLSIAGSLTGEVVRARRPLVMPDLAADPGWAASAVVGLGYRAMLAVPLTVQDRILGVLKLLGRRPRPFPSDDVEFVSALATQAALAIDNTFLLEQTRTRLREAETLLEVGRALGSTLDPTETMRRVAREIGRALGADMVGAYLADATGRRLTPIAGYHVPAALREAFVAFAIPIDGHPALEEAWTGGRAVYAVDAGNDPRVDHEAWARFPHRSSLFVPIMVKGTPIGGFFVVWWIERREFTGEEIRLVEAIGGQAAMFLENAQLYGEATRRRREAEELARLARQLTERLDAGHVSQRIVESSLGLLGGQVALLRLLAPDGTLTLVAVAGDPEVVALVPAAMPADQGAAGRAVQSGRPAWTADVLAASDVHLEPQLRDQVARRGLGARLAAPLRAEGRVIGTVGIGDRTGRIFSEAEVALLETFADQAAIALQNSRLYGDLQAALREVEESQQRIVQGERLRALGEMAAGVAHDFNNMLAIIVGRAEMVLRTTDDPEVRRQVEVINRVGGDAARTVRRIQDFTRMRRGREFEAVDLGRLLHEVTEVTRSRWKDEAQARGVAYAVQLDLAPTPPVAGDPAELREALTNMVLNALDAMPSGGRLTLATAVVEGRVACRVGDTGVGMAEDVRRRVFDPFFSTKGERGSGLGLSVVYGIARRHEAEVEVESAPGQGSTFTLWFRPGAPPPPPAAGPAPAPAPGRRILVVDDDATVGETLVELLERDGHRVALATDPAAAVGRAGQEPFDLVLSDLGMPGMSGWELAARLRGQCPGLPVVIITGWADRIEPAEVAARGVAGLLAKPFRTDTVRAAVARALAGPPAPPPGAQPPAPGS